METTLPEPSVSNVILTSGIIEICDTPEAYATLLNLIKAIWRKLPENSDNNFESNGNDRHFFGIDVENNGKSETILVVFDPPYSPETHITDHSKPATYTVMLSEEY
jgi:hypothetical protein